MAKRASTNRNWTNWLRTSRPRQLQAATHHKIPSNDEAIARCPNFCKDYSTITSLLHTARTYSTTLILTVFTVAHFSSLSLSLFFESESLKGPSSHFLRLSPGESAFYRFRYSLLSRRSFLSLCSLDLHLNPSHSILSSGCLFTSCVSPLYESLTSAVCVCTPIEYVSRSKVKLMLSSPYNPEGRPYMRTYLLQVDTYSR